MYKRIFIWVLWILLLSLPVYGVSWQEMMEKADKMVETGTSALDFSQTIRMYEEALSLSPDNYQLLWRLGRSHLYMADNLPKEERLKIYEKGRDYGEKAKELAPNSPDSHYWYASLIGRIGQTRGVLQSLFMVKPMEEALEKVLELDPEYASAYYVLSMLYMEAPGWPLSIGNKAKSLENALRSVELDPTNYDFSYNLAVVYIDQKEKGKAQQILKELLLMEEVMEDETKREEVEELLSSL